MGLGLADKGPPFVFEPCARVSSTERSFKVFSLTTLHLLQVLALNPELRVCAPNPVASLHPGAAPIACNNSLYLCCRSFSGILSLQLSEYSFMYVCTHTYL